MTKEEAAALTALATGIGTTLAHVVEELLQGAHHALANFSAS